MLLQLPTNASSSDGRLLWRCLLPININHQQPCPHHRRLACADRPPRPLVLVGDCNNTAPSHKRGGGGIVVQHPHLWEILRLMASEYGTP